MKPYNPHFNPWCWLMPMLWTFLQGLPLQAALAPKSPEQLKEQATCIVKGKVLAIHSKTRWSKIETAWGLHHDRICTLTLQVTACNKGEAAQPKGTLVIEAWQPSLRLPPLPGLQGHVPLPKKGDTLTAYLIQKNGTWVPLLPNGLVLHEAP